TSMGSKAASLVVVAFVALLAAQAAAAFHPKPGYYQWGTVGEDPMWISAGGVKGVSNPEEFIKMMTSEKGRTCAALSKIPAPVWAQAVEKVRAGEYKHTAYAPGKTFSTMCYGISGVAIIPNVQWAGKGPLGARDIPPITYQGVVYHISVPDGCANVTTNTTVAAPKPPVVHQTPTPPVVHPKPATVKVSFLKHALTESKTNPQLLYPTPTNTFK